MHQEIFTKSIYVSYYSFSLVRVTVSWYYQSLFFHELTPSGLLIIEFGPIFIKQIQKNLPKSKPYS